VDRDRRPHGWSAAVRRDLDHRPDHLVTQDQRGAQDRVASGTVRPVVQIRAADAPVRHLDHRLVGGGRAERHRLHPQIAGGVRDDAE
jgi:hypothetical protein